MSHLHLSQAVVRMLYDPCFAAAVFAGTTHPQVAALSAADLGLLRAVDPRSLRADPLRRTRTLGTILEEYQVTATLALWETRRRASLEAFFGSDEFHSVAGGRGTLAVAFGDYIERQCGSGGFCTPHLWDVVRLERAQARARREVQPVPPPSERDAESPLCLAPGCVLVTVAGDALATIQAVQRYHFELSFLPGGALCTDGPVLSLPVRSGPAPTTAILAVPLDEAVSLVELDDELSAILGAMDRAGRASEQDLVVTLQAGLAPARVHALVAELIEDEILVVSTSEPEAVR